VIKARRAFIAVLVFCAVAALAVSSSADTTGTVHFQAPVNDSVENGSYFVNEAKAGQAIPLRFSLGDGGVHGLDIFATAPLVEDITGHCDEMATDDPLAITQPLDSVAGGLSYTAGTDTYTFMWKPPARTETLQNRCWQLVMKFVDGREARANFRFF
jgi:hypothetical protein